MLNEFAYCPRLAYLEWVQGEWADSADTEEGRHVHRRVDASEDLLVRPEDVGEDGELRSVTLSAATEGLVARIDLVEVRGSERCAVPVDYKRGSPPDLPERAWEPERVQLCAQGLILRENGWTCDYGVLYFAESRQRIKVPFDDVLIGRTRQLVAELRAALAAQTIPPPLVDSPKCPRCSLVGICLPDEVNFLRQKDLAVAHRRLIPLRDDALPLYLQSHGLTVGLSGEVLEIREKGKTIGESRLIDTSQVCLLGNVQISTQAVRGLADRGIPICYFTYGGWFSAITVGMTHKNVELRRHQFAAAFDEAICLGLARRFVEAKVRNCLTFLRRNHRELPVEVPLEFKRLARATSKATSLEALLGIEGLAGRLYFSHFQGMFKSRSQELVPFDFHERNRRPPRDPVNALLSFAYSLLVKEFAVAALAIGLDPYQGFYHQPRYGRPALALDLMEEFRPIIADSVVLWALNNGVVTADGFQYAAGGVALKPATRKAFLEAYERRLEESVIHPIFGYRISYRRVLNVQTRLLARYLAGEIPGYPAFLTR